MSRWQLGKKSSRVNHSDVADFADFV